MKKFRKLLILSFVLTLLLGNLTVRVSAEDTTVPSQDETTVTTTDYSAEDEAEKRAREQQEALNAAVEEARRKAAEQTQQYQQEIDTQTYQSNDNVWQAIDEKIEPEDGRKKITTTTNSESVKKEDTDKEETVTEKAVKKEVAANVDLGGGSSIAVTTKYGSLSDNTVLSVTELGDSALLEFADRVGLANVVDGRYFVVNLLDENGESVTASRPLTVSLNSVDVNGELVNIYAANSETYELYAEGLTNTGVVDYTFETKDYDTFVILSTGTKAEETVEPQATGLTSLLQNVPFLAIFNKTEETETGLSGRTETSFTNDFVLNETEVETEGYPAFKATKTISGTSMEIVVDAPAGAFPEGIQLYAEVVPTPQEVKDVIEDAENTEMVSFDIHFYLEENPEEEIEPNVPILVTFNNLAINSETVDVYHETEMIDTVNTDSATLELDGFSNFTFIKSTKAPRLLGDAPTNDSTDPAANNAERYESIPVTIVWEDDNNRDGKRPGTLYLRLYRGDTYVRQNGVKTTKDSSIFTENTSKPDLTFDKYDSDGTTLLVYSVYTSTTGSGEIVPLENYNVEVTGDAANGFTVTLTHTPEVIRSIAVKKVWEDDNNRDGLRPSEVAIRLLKNGEWTGRSNYLSDANDWKATFGSTEEKPLYKYENGKEIEYSVVEREVPTGYEMSVTGDAVTGFTVTNTHEPKLLTIEATNTWDDNKNVDNIRPKTIYVHVFRQLAGEEEYVGYLELNATNNWNASADKLQNNLLYVNAPVNQKYDYVFVESTEATQPESSSDKSGEPKDYNVGIVGTPSTDGSNKISVAVTNTHNPYTREIEVKKIWENENNDRSHRPEYVKVKLIADGVLTDQSRNLYSGIRWRSTFIDLPVNKPNPDGSESGVEIQYTVEEVTIPFYVSRISGDMENGFTVTNELIPNKTSVTIKKEWVDDDNTDTRPNVVHVLLMRDGKPTGYEARIGKNDDWTVTFNDVDVYADPSDPNSIIEYRVEEDVVAGYELEEIVKSGDPVMGYTYTITNVRKDIDLYNIDINVSINWDDQDDRDGIRPDFVNATLYANGDPVLDEFDEEIVIKLNQGNNYSGTFENMPRYSATGNTGSVFGKNSFLALPDMGEPIEYTVEVDDKSPYTITESGDMESGFVFTYTYEPETIDSITVKKVWDDADNQDGIRPETVTYTLLADGVEVDTTDPITVTAEGEATYTWNDYYRNQGGVPINYTVVEGELENYTPKYQVETDETTGDITVTVTNKYSPDTRTITVVKSWDDNDDQDGIRPETVTVNLIANDDKDNPVDTAELSKENGWAHYFEEVPKNSNDGTGSKPIEYTVEEVLDDETKEKYTASYSDFADSGYITITNTHKPETAIFTIVKEWDDNSNQDGIRPSSVTFNLESLYFDGQSNPHIPVDTQIVISATSFNSDPNRWEKEIELPLYFDGQKVLYGLSEQTVEGYNPDKSALILVEDDDNKFTNTHIPELITIPITKVWDDDSNRDGIRPDTILGHLVGTVDGKTVVTRDFDWGGNTTWASKTTTITKDNDGNKLPKYHKGKEIEYTVTEDKYDGYTTEITGDAANGFTVTNTHVPEAYSITVVKEWDDNNNQDGLRPESVQVTLEDGTGNTYKQSILAANGWVTVFEDLPVKAEGSVLTYTLTEDEVAQGEYEPDADQYSTTLEDGDVELVITNSHTPATIQITGHVIWNDNSNQDGVRPEKVTVHLYADGEEVGTQEVTPAEGDENQWTYVFEDLPKNYNGQPINYTVSEDAIDDYSMRVQGYDITNSYTPGKTFLTVIKLWDDDRDRDGLRPDNCIVRLLADGEEVNRASLSEGTGWFTVFSDLDKMKDGKEITYTVEEDKIPEYKTEITGDQKEGYVIKNSHTPEKVSVTLRAKWIDDNDKLCKRPDQVKAFLMANGYPIDARILNEKNEWMATIDNLPKYAYGKPIQYTISEQPFKHYEISNIGMTAYNKLENCCNLCSGSECKPIIPKTGVDAMPTYHNPNYLLLAK